MTNHVFGTYTGSRVLGFFTFCLSLCRAPQIWIGLWQVLLVMVLLLHCARCCPWVVETQDCVRDR